MRIEILDKAETDLVEGYLFYDAQQAGVGTYFLESIYSDIESLRLYTGIHRMVYRNYYRMLSKHFPFAIFTHWRKILCAFMPLSIAAAIQPGSEGICTNTHMS